MSFVNDSGFCANCGSILPLPTDPSEHFVRCGCGYKIDVEKFNNVTVSKINLVFNELESEKKKQKKSGEIEGPTIERDCQNCGHTIMAYTTQQTRSVDEGLTVFYRCLMCGKLEVEEG